MGGERAGEEEFLRDFGGNGVLAGNGEQTVEKLEDDAAIAEGLVGNEDVGQMSAWYVFSALGFYPVNPASGEYVIGTPTVDRAVLRLPGGRTFTVTARRKGGAEAVYVKSVRLNGQKLDGWTLKHADLMAGGTLEFDLGTRPKGKVLELR